MRPTHYVLLSAAVAFLLKLYCASTTIGTNDVVMFNHWGKLINRNGLAHTYQTMPLFNHTPLIAAFSAGLQKINGDDAANLGKSEVPLLLRLPGIAADFLMVLVLLRIRQLTGSPPWWALTLFALSPVSYMVSGYHGNVDSVLALMLLVAVWMCVEKKPVLCGLAIGLACQIKVIPLLFTPLFFMFWWEQKKWRPYFITASLLILAGWSPAMVNVPLEFYRNTLSYPGYWGIWGISYWLRATGIEGFQKVGAFELHAMQNTVMSVSKYLIIFSVLAVAWRRRKDRAESLFCSIAFIWAVFFVLSTGIAAQYFVWLAPFILVATPRWYAWITASCSLFLFAFYNTISNFSPTQSPWNPGLWNIGFSEGKHLPFWGPWHVAPWLALIAYLVWHVAKRWRCKLPNNEVMTDKTRE